MIVPVQARRIANLVGGKIFRCFWWVRLIRISTPHPTITAINGKIGRPTPNMIKK
jgi:hypothetical protein